MSGGCENASTSRLPAKQFRMKKQIEQVREFYEAFRVPYNKRPIAPVSDRQFLRWRLLQEEVTEYSKEVRINEKEVDMAKMTKELVDIAYVLFGTVLEFGLQGVFEEAFDRVQASNMSKLRSDGTPIIREDGKILKSENYFEPDMGFVNLAASSYNLFLDDIRNPADAHPYTKQRMFVDEEWAVVRSYDEFVAHIEENGMPAFVSFDHDLADSHYAPEHLWQDYDASKEWQDAQIHTEKTGFDAAKWLCEYCDRNGLDLPGYFCHSMNPVGKDKILAVLAIYQSEKNIACTP